jgi:hypothetical protein
LDPALVSVGPVESYSFIPAARKVVPFVPDVVGQARIVHHLGYFLASLLAPLKRLSIFIGFKLKN